MKLLSTLCACLLLSTAAVAEPRLEASFGHIPAVIDIAISPDGKHVALLGGTATGRAVSIATVDEPGIPSLALGDLDAFDLRWVGNEHVLARVSAWKSLGPREAYSFERQISVNAQAQQVATLLDGDQFSQYLLSQELIGVTEDPPRAMMLGLRAGIGATIVSMDPATGRSRITDTLQPGAFKYGVDAAGVLRFQAYLEGRDRRYSVLYRPNTNSAWKRVWGADWGSDRLFGYSAGDNAIYLMENDRIVRLNPDSGVKETIGPDQPWAIPTLYWDQYADRPVAIATGLERMQTEWLDPELGAVHASLARTFKDRRVELAAWSRDRKRVVAKVGGWDHPTAWYLFDRERKEVSPLGEAYPELKGVRLGTTRWLGFKARDGLEMGAYLTLPPGATANAKLPVIVLPHDNADLRDSEEFDYLAHYLASLGYAVIRPQYRGSAIFDTAFKEAGHGEWAGKISTDLLDAVQAAAATGAVDPKRACIVGVGFGGYQALAGVAFHAGDYQCAASIGGVSSLGLLIVDSGRLVGRESPMMRSFRAELGNLNRMQLEAASPAKNARSIGAPVLLIHGDHDVDVPIEHSTLMADALKAAGKPYELVVLPGENHGLYRSQTRTQVLATLGQFLAKNLPPTANRTGVAADTSGGGQKVS